MKTCISSVRLAVFPLAMAAAFPAFSQTNTTGTLSTVIVSGHRYQHDEQTAPYATSVLTGAQILASGATDANDAIRRLLGVPYRTDLRGGRDYVLDLRGFGATADQNVVVVVDGVRISENELATARLSAISPEMIESIEVVRGGSSVQWGEGASAGVINVVLKQGAAQGVHGSATAQLESFRGRDVRAQLSVGEGAMALDAYLRRYNSDGYRANSQNHQDTAAVGLTGQAGGLKYRLRVNQEDQDSRFPGPLSFTEFVANPRQTLTPNDFGASHETRWTGGLDYREGSLAYAVDVGTRKRETTSHFTGFDSRSHSESTQLSPKLTYTGKLGTAAMTLLGGTDFQRWHFGGSNNFGQNEVGSQSNNAWFGSADVLTSTDTRFTAGLRRENVRKIGEDPANFVSYNRSDSLSAWDVGISQTLFTGLNVYGRLAKAYRLANVDENRYLAAALRPQVTHDTELGVKWRNSQAMSASARVFRQSAVDEIAYDPLSFSNVNLDPTRRSGIELEARAQIAKGWSLSGSVQTVKARFSSGANAGLEIPLVSSIAGAVRLGWQLDARQLLELGLQHLGSARFGNDNSNTCAAKIPASTLMDARYAYQVDRLEIAVTASNLANKSGYSYAYSCASGSLYPDPGRKLGVTAKYSF